MADTQTVARIGGNLKATFGPVIEEQQNKKALFRNRYGKADNAYFRAPGDHFEFPARIGGNRAGITPTASDDALATPGRQQDKKFTVTDRGYSGDQRRAGGRGFRCPVLGVRPDNSCAARPIFLDAKKSVHTSRFVAAAIGMTAVRRFGVLAIGADGCLRVHAPIHVVSSVGNTVVFFGEDELALPAERRAEVGMMDGEEFL